MLSDEFPEWDIYAPEADARSTFVIHLHVDDADATIEQAVSAGARLVRAPQDQFYGERSGTVRDPFGYDWMIGHSIEEIDPDEMQRRTPDSRGASGSSGGLSDSDPRVDRAGANRVRRLVAGAKAIFAVSCQWNKSRRVPHRGNRRGARIKVGRRPCSRLVILIARRSQ